LEENGPDYGSFRAQHPECRRNQQDSTDSRTLRAERCRFSNATSAVSAAMTERF
jgi:hypothetical protein